MTLSVFAIMPNETVVDRVFMVKRLPCKFHFPRNSSSLSPPKRPQDVKGGLIRLNLPLSLKRMGLLS